MYIYIYNISRIEKQASKQASKQRIIAANILRVPIATCKFDPKTNSGTRNIRCFHKYILSLESDL